MAAVAAVDRCLGRLADAVEAAGGALLITADHGNAEKMRGGDGETPHTAHTHGSVPAVLAGAPGVALRDGTLADIAPTVLDLMGLAQAGGDDGALAGVRRTGLCRAGRGRRAGYAPLGNHRLDSAPQDAAAARHRRGAPSA